jgi:hypothetical protein
MARADLYAHSKYSMDRDEWALKALGVCESFAGSGDICKSTKLAQLDFVVRIRREPRELGTIDFLSLFDIHDLDDRSSDYFPR